ncbi:MAG: signal peptidase I [Planctomycetales bacterium]|nr:signal peptidase I [Planctomycetales bacterium]
MTTAAITAKSKGKKQTAVKSNELQSVRETVESVVVAFILAFLFRAFVAEAFVIPTGSMAPTLMGAHKDVVCEYCGNQYQAGASEEFNSETGAFSNAVTIASTCAVCRGRNVYDLRGNANHDTFSGDRILVSKFDYVLSDPKRWDVLVFKYPDESRMNYIKRLIGLPGEQLQISGGDIYIKSDSDWQIARKPPGKIRAMRQVVSDTSFRAEALIDKGWPSLWQPWSGGEQNGRFAIEHSSDAWSAKLTASPSPEFIRYYHKVADSSTWRDAEAGRDIPEVNPYASQLITDFLSYNSSLTVPRSYIYVPGSSVFDENYNVHTASQMADGASSRGIASAKRNSGYHWVGDLISDFDVEILSESGTFIVDTIEFGVRFRASINVADGSVVLTCSGEEGAIEAFGGTSSVEGTCRLRGAGKYRVELANVDDQIVLWVNGKVAEFSKPTEFDSRTFRNGSQRRPHWSETDPLDAAPLAIGGQEIDLAVSRARVFRDIYYISIQGGSEYSDYNLFRESDIRAATPELSATAGRMSAIDMILEVYAHPEWWSETSLFDLRGDRNFQLDAGQYFPMGDNSSSSFDARAWRGGHFVDERYLLGKALLVFWPHTWNSPVPYTPNFARMGLIR